MSSERRIVRPFNLGSGLARCLEGARAHVGARMCEPGGKIFLNHTDSFRRFVPSLSWSKDETEFRRFKTELRKELQEHNIRSDAACLVVTAYTNYLKITDVLLLQPVDKIDTLQRVSSFDGADCGRALQARIHGAELTAYLVLSRDIEQKPLRPWRKGTWLARANFQIRTRVEVQLFRPIPMDKKIRADFGLPRDCVQYLYLGDHDPLRPYAESTAPQFYVDKDLLNQLHQYGSSAVGEGLQADLARGFIESVIIDVAASDRVLDLLWDDVKNSLFGKIVAMAAGKSASVEDREQHIQLVRNDPQKLLALVESALKLRTRLVKALSQDD